MDVFRVVKDNVTARQMAEYYGIKIGRNGMACCRSMMTSIPV